jgi:hypothetical protein
MLWLKADLANTAQIDSYQSILWLCCGGHCVNVVELGEMINLFISNIDPFSYLSLPIIGAIFTFDICLQLYQDPSID